LIRIPHLFFITLPRKTPIIKTLCRQNTPSQKTLSS
jgi:hypothetical protein